MQFPADLFTRSVRVATELNAHGVVTMAVLTEALDLRGDLRQHLNKTCNHHTASTNLAGLRAGVALVADRKMSFKELAETMTAYVHLVVALFGDSFTLRLCELASVLCRFCHP